MHTLQILLAASVVLFVPGMPLAWALGLTRILPAQLIPAALTVCSLCVISLLLWISLMWELPIRVVEGGIGGLSGFVAIGLLIRALDRSGSQFGTRDLAGRAISGVRSLGVGAPLIALATGLFTWTLGGTLRGDALYHTAQALKLQHLRHPNFGNTLEFLNGSGHPGYYLPTWHETIALIAKMTGTAPIDVMYVLPALMVGIATLACGGLARVIFRMPIAAPLGALAFALVQVFTTSPAFFAAVQGAYPRQVATDVILPVAIAAFFLACHLPEKTPRRGALALLVLATAMIVVVHVSYVFLLALAIGGYMFVWLLQLPVPRAMIGRHLIAAFTAGFVALAGVGVLLPKLHTLDSFAQGSKTEKVLLGTLDAPEIPKGLKLGELFIGQEGSYHLRPDYLVWYGALSLIGFLCVVLVIRFRRHPASWLLGGSTMLVTALALNDWAFPLLLQAMGSSQAKRITLAVPAALGLTLGMLVFARVLEWLWSRGGAFRGAGVALALVVGAALVCTTCMYPLLLDVLEPDIPEEPIVWTLYALAGAAAVALVLMVVRAFRWLRAGQRFRFGFEYQLEWDAPLLGTTPRALSVLLVGALVVAGSTPALARSVREANDRWDRRPDTAHSTGSLDRYDAVYSKLRDLKPGTVVMAEPEVAHELMALTPVYVVSSLPGHTANTKKNKIYDRYQTVEDFYSGDPEDEELLDILDENKVEVLVLRRDKAGRKLERFVKRNPRLFAPIRRSDRIQLWQLKRFKYHW